MFTTCNQIRVYAPLADFSQILAKVCQSCENSDLIVRGERATLSDRFELSRATLGLKLAFGRNPQQILPKIFPTRASNEKWLFFDGEPEFAVGIEIRPIGKKLEF